MRDRLFIALLFLTLVSSSVIVLHPGELKKKIGNDGVIKSSLGNFGHFQYGTTLVKMIDY
jgi:hypothetical protein